MSLFDIFNLVFALLALWTALWRRTEHQTLRAWLFFWSSFMLMLSFCASMTVDFVMPIEDWPKEAMSDWFFRCQVQFGWLMILYSLGWYMFRALPMRIISAFYFMISLGIGVFLPTILRWVLT